MKADVHTSRCSKCGEVKPLEEFHKNVTHFNGRQNYCKICQNKVQREAYSTERAMTRHRKYKYELSSDEYESLLKSQEGRCAICEHKMKTPHVDHDHETGKIRGLLCRKCNTGLGMFGDNLVVLEKAVEYLQEAVL